MSASFIDLERLRELTGWNDGIETPCQFHLLGRTHIVVVGNAFWGSEMTNDAETASSLSDEARVVEQLQQMDSEAWRKVVTLYAADLRWDITTSLKKRNLSPQAAEDIEQQTWLTAVQKINSFTLQGSGKLYHWLRVIALNHVRTFSKQSETVPIDAFETSEGDSDAALDRFLYAIRSTDNTIEDEVELRQQLSQLDHVLRHLTPRDRELILRRLVWEETPMQLAQDYPSLTARSISQTLLRAKKVILAFLSASDSEQQE